MCHPHELERFVSAEMPTILMPQNVVLDIGLGRGYWGFMIRCYRSENHVYLVGIDIHKRRLNFIKEFPIYDDLVLCDASRLPFKANCFSLVMACEVIEHLLKPKGIELLSDIEYVNNGRIILTTPNGDYAPATFHRAQWYVSDFKSRGYKVKGVGFRACKLFKRNLYLSGFFFYVFTPLSYILPRMGAWLIAVKDKKHD